MCWKPVEYRKDLGNCTMLIERDSQSSDNIICTACGLILLVFDLENGEESIIGSETHGKD